MKRFVGLGLIEKELHTMVKSVEREDLLLERQPHPDHLPKTTAAQIAEREKSEEVLEERVQFDYLISNVTAVFVNLPPERVDGEITRVLGEVCQFFGADHCSLLEVLADRKQVNLLNINVHEEEGRRELLNVDIASGHPWAYHRLVEQGEPIIFSSLASLPPEASVDRGAWEHEGVHALLMLPLRVAGQVKHLIGLPSHCTGHEWPAIDMHRLRVLGEIFVGAMLHKRAQEALLRSERWLAEAQRIAHLGSWNWDIVLGDLQWSDEVYRIFGLNPKEFCATYTAFLASVHPDDRRAVEQAIADALADPRTEYNVEHRVVRPNGSERIVHTRGETTFDVDGKPRRMFGTVLDITERKQTEAALQAAFEEIKRYKEQIEAENIHLREEVGLGESFSQIVGVSDVIQYVKFRIRQVAQTKATALLIGETGTGKGVFARALHDASNRKGKAFVHVNCAGLPPNLIESELFGREKGAFTGSTARQIGRFELANGGTIYLDEIGELPLDLQAKLLKVLEDETFERLGNPRAVTVDVRVIASTNRDLEEELKRGRFRKDLFYRLNVFPVTIPPLRQRKEDIPLLVRFYVHRFSKSYGRSIKRIPRNIMKALENYSWPGNVRELINIVERAVIVSDGSKLQLAEQIGTPPIYHPRQANVSESSETREARSLVEVQRQHILETLQETGWRIEGHNGAAQRLALNPSTLRARMRKLDIKKPTPQQSLFAIPPSVPIQIVK